MFFVRCGQVIQFPKISEILKSVREDNAQKSLISTYLGIGFRDYFCVCLGVDKGVAEGGIDVALRREVHDPGRKKI